MTESSVLSQRVQSSFRQPYVWVLLVLLLTTILSVPELAAPISGDTGIYAYIGRALAHGQVLYRDVWDFKPPGIYYLFALLFRVLPDSLMTLRVTSIIFIDIGVLGCWFLARRFFTPTTAVVLTAFVAIWTQLGGVLNGDGPFPETFILPLMVLAYWGWFRYKKSQQWPWLFWCGLIGGVLSLFKQTSVVTPLGMALVLIIEGVVRLYGPRQIIIALAALGLGFAIVIVPWFFYFAAHNALSDMTAAIFRYPSLYAATTLPTEAVINALIGVSGLASALGLLYVMVPVGVWVYWKQCTGQGLQTFIRSPFFALLVWSILEVISVSAPRRFYARYWLQPLLALALIAGLGIDLLVKANWKPNAEYRRPLLIGLVSLFIFATAASLPWTFTHLNHRVLSFQETRAEAVADYLRSHSSPTDAVFAWGDNRIPYVAARPSGVKWINTEPFQTSQAYSTDPTVVGELLNELQTNPPRYFVEASVYNHLGQSFLAGSAVDKFIQQHYHLIAHIQDAELYEYQ
ncbi:MAG: glycosyltransferase family 39 protein [Aggregatilineales bacterium]